MIVSTRRKRDHTVEAFNRQGYFSKVMEASLKSKINDTKLLELRFGSECWRIKFGVTFGACCIQLGVALKDEEKRYSPRRTLHA